MHKRPSSVRLSCSSVVRCIWQRSSCIVPSCLGCRDEVGRAVARGRDSLVPFKWAVRRHAAPGGGPGVGAHPVPGRGNRWAQAPSRELLQRARHARQFLRNRRPGTSNSSCFGANDAFRARRSDGARSWVPWPRNDMLLDLPLQLVDDVCGPGGSSAAAVHRAVRVAAPHLRRRRGREPPDRPRPRRGARGVGRAPVRARPGRPGEAVGGGAVRGLAQLHGPRPREPPLRTRRAPLSRRTRPGEPTSP